MIICFLTFLLSIALEVFASSFPNINYIPKEISKNILIKNVWNKDSQLPDIFEEEFTFLEPNLNKAQIEPSDQSRDLVDAEITRLLTSVIEIHEKGLSAFELEPLYWTGYFWALRVGLLGGRLADGKFLRTSNWEERLEYVKSNPPSTYFPKKIHLLSPSEKYDLLIGDSEGNLTSLMWRRGQETMDRYGQISPWIGLCDGLAMATINLPIPKKSISVWSFDGKYKIKFFPEDLKALGTLLWKQGSFSYRMIGERCDETLPEVNENGRYTSAGCFNTNPGTFHISLVNQIGRAKRSFVMDSVSGSEVWNYPVVGYSFTYFNPQTLISSPGPQEAIIPIGDFTNDKYTKYRSPLSTHIVGVEVKVNTLKDQYPRFSELEGPSDNKFSIETYKYDLELNKEGKIIGGEWADNNHPDFLWIGNKDSIPKGPFDDLLEGNWDAKSQLFPTAWIEPSIKSSKAGIVPHQIVKALFELSNQEGDGFNPNQKP